MAELHGPTVPFLDRGGKLFPARVRTPGGIAFAEKTCKANPPNSVWGGNLPGARLILPGRTACGMYGSCSQSDVSWHIVPHTGDERGVRAKFGFGLV